MRQQRSRLMPKRKPFALGALEPSAAVDLAHDRVVDAWEVLARGCDWTRLDERSRRRLAGPMGSVARAMGDLELLSSELANEQVVAA